MIVDNNLRSPKKNCIYISQYLFVKTFVVSYPFPPVVHPDSMRGMKEIDLEILLLFGWCSGHKVILTSSVTLKMKSPKPTQYLVIWNK